MDTPWRDHRLTLLELVDPLCADGMLSDAEAADLRALAASLGQTAHPLVWLSERKLNGADGQLLTLDRLVAWLAHHVDLPLHQIDPLKIQVDSVTSAVSPAYTARYRILPVLEDAYSVTFATAEPYERAWEDEMAHVLRREVRRVIANPIDIERYQRELFGVSHSIRQASRATQDNPLGINNLEALVELGRTGKLDANDQHVVSIVDWLMQYAFDQRASDIHLEPRREQGNVRFRIDGMLHSVYEIPTPILTAITARIKALGRMDVVEKRRPQDGRVKTRTPNGDEVELRLSTMPTAFGEKLVMRIFDPQVLLRDLSQLGFGKRDKAIWHEITQAPYGIVLVTGPTGSGKTTTLYSTLRHLATPEVNVCTVEDPIEMVESSFNQMQVQSNIGLDFASGVRTLMRQDPDIIMVGEIRDLETAEMAIQAALTGHLVLSTLHTNDAPSALVRMMDLGVPSYLLNATILGVVAQRLVRTLCPHCKTSEPVEEDSWRDLTTPWKLPLPKALPKANGCDHCRHSGYAGRVGLYESLRMTHGFRSRVKPDSDIAALRRQALRDGMESLRISGARKVLAGLTTLEEVLRVAPISEFESARQQ